MSPKFLTGNTRSWSCFACRGDHRARAKDPIGSRSKCFWKESTHKDFDLRPRTAPMVLANKLVVDVWSPIEDSAFWSRSESSNELAAV